VSEDGMPKKSKYRDGRASNRPPEHTRFRPGQSGNPKGRPRGKHGFDASLKTILEEIVAVRVGDRIRRMSMLQAVQRGWLQRAMKGDGKALKAVREIMEEVPSLVGPVPLVQLCFVDDGSLPSSEPVPPPDPPDDETPQ